MHSGFTKAAKDKGGRASPKGYKQGKTVEETLRDFYKEVQSSNLTRKLIDPMLHGRGVVQLMTNPAMNGVTHRADGGTIRSIFG